jgi:pyrroline-5-carboxylate reductase
MLKIGFLGSGKMAQALAKGFVASGKLAIFMKKPEE